MKVLIVNTFDKGGAASACMRLHKGLLREGIDAKVLLKHKEKSLDRTYELGSVKREGSFFSRVIHKILHKLNTYGIFKARVFKDREFKNMRLKQLELFTFPYSDFDITTSPLYKEADIINLHWVAGLIDYKSFFEKNTKPVVWTLHDMNPFTGGEHYEEKIIGMDGLGYPVIREIQDFEKEMFKRILHIKQSSLSKVNNLHIVSLCQWMSKEVGNSGLFKNYPLSLIPNGIDSSIFFPRDVNNCRNDLGIPKDKLVVLFVADAINNYRKGFEFLEHALSVLKRENVVLCAVGKNRNKKNTSCDIIELGKITDENTMSMVYSAADVFVIPSLMDNLPNTVLESLHCGTPVIGFPVGGIIDMVKNEENGLIAEDISSASLLNVIKKFINLKSSFNREHISEQAKRKYSLEIQAKSYIKLFKSMLE